MIMCFVVKQPASPEIYKFAQPLSHHDALPIYRHDSPRRIFGADPGAHCPPFRQYVPARTLVAWTLPRVQACAFFPVWACFNSASSSAKRSEEHTSEIQSLMRI